MPNGPSYYDSLSKLGLIWIGQILLAIPLDNKGTLLAIIILIDPALIFIFLDELGMICTIIHILLELSDLFDM